ncbi:MAG: gliding motility-associated C-terminal domain-containing protein [Saprospiraceae bacterium]
MNIPDPSLCVDDGDCTNGIETWNTTTCMCDITPTVLGCTNSTATNYDPNATCDDGSCIFTCPDPGNCDDGDCSNGEEIWDGGICECITINIPDPSTCIDDGDCINGEETWNSNTCECEQLNIPDPSTCIDDGNCTNGEETWNANTCECEQLNIPDPSTCVDDGDCTNGIETWNTTTCMCDITPTVLGCTNSTATNYDPNATCDDGSCIFTCPDPGNCDDGDCTNGEEIWDGGICECITINIPDPSTCVDDGDCTNGEETWNITTCECEQLNIPDPSTCIDDGDCSNGEETWNTTTCECEQLNIPDPSTCVDDGDCSNGEETWNTTTCECEQLNIPDPSTCVDDGDCTNGIETWNSNNCECEQLNIPDPSTCVDDGDCTNGVETWNSNTCECEQLNIPDPSTCIDDGDCTNGIETWNSNNCECESTPVDCSNSPTSIVTCDDGDPCTINDTQTILDCDGTTICIPCQGVSATVGAPQINSIDLCQNDILPTINASGGGNIFLWYDTNPSSGGVIPIFSGTDFIPNIDSSVPDIYNYWVTETVDNCEGEISAFTVTVTANPVADAGQDMILDCITNETMLQGNGSVSNPSISWTGPDPNMDTQILDPIVTVSGTYELMITDDNCSSTDEVVVSSLDEIFAFDDNVLLQDFNLTEIDALVNDNLQGYSNVNLAILNTPNGAVEVQNDGTVLYTPNPNLAGVDEIQYEICAEECPDICAEATIQITIISETIEVPDAFSPNGDNKNDFWVIPGIENYPNNQLTVINRWGNAVFEAAPYDNNWNGTNKKGKDLPEGTYYFILRLDVVNEAPINGSITIVR